MDEVKGVKEVVGIATFNRPEAFRGALESLSRSDVNGLVVVADATNSYKLDAYKAVIEEYLRAFERIVYETSLGRRGSTAARNGVLELFSRNYSDKDLLIMFDDDYVALGGCGWLRGS